MLLTNTSPRAFTGRNEILGILDKRIESLKQGYRQNVALTGQKLCGKTTILQQFLANLKDDSVIPVYIELLTEQFDSFARKFIGTMLFSFFKTSPGSATEEIQALIRKADAVIPKTAASIKEILKLIEKGDNQEAYSLLFNLTSVLKGETGRSCVIILDEFHNLSFFNLKNPFAVFGKKIMVQKDTMYIVTSSQVSSIKKILKEKLDLLFGNFEILEVRDFEYSVSRKFLEKRLEAIKIQDELKDFLIAFTDGRPFYLDIIASELTNMAAQLQFKWLSSNHIAQALENLLFDSKGTINQYFQNLITVFSPAPLMNDYTDILSALSEGKKKLYQIRASFGGKKGDIPKRLNKLVEESLLTQNGSIYYFNDRVFEFWIKYVYNRKRYSLVNIFQDRSNIFKKDIENIISAFIVENKKTLGARIEALFGSFNNEILKIGEKNLKFPHFNNIKTEKHMEGAGGYTIMRADYQDGKSWVFSLTNSCVDETTMGLLIEELKRRDPGPQKKILIALSGIETNAMLLAKENKIWVWSKDTLNLVMLLYGKFKIMGQP